MKTLITIAFLLFAVSSFGQINDDAAFIEGSYSKDYIRKHKIKTVTKTSYPYNNNLSATVYHFDRNGLLEKQSIIDSIGKVQVRFAFKFNKYGDLIQRITLPYDKYPSDTFVIKREYNNRKIIKESSTYSPLTTQHFYNRKGNRIRTIHPYNNGRETLIRRIIDYKYDNTGRLLHVTDRVYGSNSNDIEQWMSDQRITYVGHKPQNLIERILNGDIPTNKGNISYSYDNAGNLTSIVSDTVASYYYTYNDKGLLISKRVKFPEGFDTLSDANMIDKYTYKFRR